MVNDEVFIPFATISGSRTHLDLPPRQLAHTSPQLLPPLSPDPPCCLSKYPRQPRLVRPFRSLDIVFKSLLQLSEIRPRSLLIVSHLQRDQFRFLFHFLELGRGCCVFLLRFVGSFELRLDLAFLLCELFDLALVGRELDSLGYLVLELGFLLADDRLEVSSGRLEERRVVLGG
jgi:hypothetical protein